MVEGGLEVTGEMWASSLRRDRSCLPLQRMHMPGLRGVMSAVVVQGDEVDHVRERAGSQGLPVLGLGVLITISLGWASSTAQEA